VISVCHAGRASLEVGAPFARRSPRRHLPPVPDPRLAALPDRYLLERELGAGGMATVYLAEDVKHGRKVALKVLRTAHGLRG